ncbi:MAG TPA: DUF3450 family protein [Cellvibrionaceae bacterium]
MRILLTFVLLFPLLAHAAESTSLEKLMNTWLNLESQRGKLVTDWNERKQQLENRITLLDREANVLEEMLDEASSDVSEVDERRQALTVEQQNLEQQQTLMQAAVDRAIIQLQALAVRIPPPLEKDWQKGLEQLNREELSLSEKLEKILSLSKSAEQFERRIAVHRDIMALPAEDQSLRNVQVTQIYMGLSQGWYVNSTADRFGYGYADANGWHWQHMTENNRGEIDVDAKQLLRLLAMIENPTQAEYLILPVSTDKEEDQ